MKCLQFWVKLTVCKGGFAKPVIFGIAKFITRFFETVKLPKSMQMMDSMNKTLFIIYIFHFKNIPQYMLKQ